MTCSTSTWLSWRLFQTQVFFCKTLEKNNVKIIFPAGRKCHNSESRAFIFLKIFRTEESKLTFKGYKDQKSKRTPLNELRHHESQTSCCPGALRGAKKKWYRLGCHSHMCPGVDEKYPEWQVKHTYEKHLFKKDTADGSTEQSWKSTLFRHKSFSLEWNDCMLLLQDWYHRLPHFFFWLR